MSITLLKLSTFVGLPHGMDLFGRREKGEKRKKGKKKKKKKTRRTSMMQPKKK